MPGLELYDKALIDKISYWTKNTKLKVYGPNEARQTFMSIIDENKDQKISLPLLTLTRNGGFTINNPNKQPLSYDGIVVDGSYEKAAQLNGIPVTVNYQLDIYTRYMQEAEELIRALIFNFINYPKIEVIVPYNGMNVNHISSVRIGQDVEDNSDIPERLIPHQFTRQTLNIYIDDAYLWDIKIRDNLQIEVDDVFTEKIKS